MSRKLLLADDSVTIQKVVEIVLAEEGFDVRIANNGEEALADVPVLRPDIVLADVEMPVMDGYQLCEKIKMNPDTKDIPVILLAGAFEPFDEGHAKDVGANDYIIKPFESAELMSKINAALAASDILKEKALEAEPSEAVEVTETAEAEEWEDEEVLPEPAEEEIVVEMLNEKGLSLDEEYEIAEVFQEAVEAEKPSLGEVPELKEKAAVPEDAVSVKPSVVTPVMPQFEIPSREDFADIFKNAVNDSISSLLSGLDVKGLLLPDITNIINDKISSLVSDFDIKDLLLQAVTSLIKDSIEQFVREIAPEIAEKVTREILQGTLASLNKEVEKIIWETVPDLAEAIISKEIEKIKSGT